MNRAYIEFIHNSIDGNCEHKITVYESIQECENQHDTLSKCNSNEFITFSDVDLDDNQDDCADLYEFELAANGDDDAQWLVFVFYEHMVTQAYVYSTRKEALDKFDEQCQDMTPDDDEDDDDGGEEDEDDDDGGDEDEDEDECSKITECSENDMICSLYVKNYNGSYTLPDKAKRVAMVKLPSMHETKYV